MSHGRAEDSNLAYSVADGEYEVIDKTTNNLPYIYLDKTAANKNNPEELHLDKMPGSDFSHHVEKTDDNKKANTVPLKIRRIRPMYLIAILLAFVLLIAASIAFVIAFVEISKLRSEISILQSALPEQPMSIQQAIESTIEAKFRSIKNELNKSEQYVNLSIDQLFSEVNNTRFNEIISIIRDKQVFASCAEIQTLMPLSPSGYYNIRRSARGSAIAAYCDMTRSCGGITGGWMRVVDLDMTDNTTQCPGNLELSTNPLRTCRVRDPSAGICSSDMFTVDGVQYSKVCGRIKAYMVGSPDAFDNTPNIDYNYVDGVSLTHGNPPRQHVWTFAGALNEDDIQVAQKCACSNTAISNFVPPTPPFVGDDYFCDTAVASGFNNEAFYDTDPLWDGAGCGPQSTCCSFNSPPWFYKQLPLATTDDIEMRVCNNEGADNEDIAIEIIELYVQ